MNQPRPPFVVEELSGLNVDEELIFSVLQFVDLEFDRRLNDPIDAAGPTLSVFE